ncbi:MAG TPA: IPT/TIG domain-containing protein, partial [Bryobacteraceae bacterium]|nr:IPT/TIG domain-containing protein [Bryobacteraceae bacterium]
MRYSSALAVVVFVSLLPAKQDNVTCGTHPDTWKEELHLHHQALRNGLKRSKPINSLAVSGETLINGNSVRPDIGNIAILDDTSGVVARRNSFDLTGRTVRFIPSTAAATRYRYENLASNYDAVTAASGTLLRDLGDDDTQETRIAFPFPFFGSRYSSVFINSDGNLTFGASDTVSTDRSLGRVNSGSPRIAPLFRDLDPTQSSDGVRLTSSANRFTVSWVTVPDYSDTGTGVSQTFQVSLFPDGRIEFAYNSVRTSTAVVGISPGSLQGEAVLTDLSTASATEYSATLAERFTNVEEIDIYSAAQKFYLNHEDAYDILVFYNNLNIEVGDNVVANEATLRNNRSGYGDPKVEAGLEAGSKRRLQAIVNMGQLTQYPRNPNGRVPARLGAGDTPLSVLGHEIGHLFLAFASVRDPNDPDARPMLGRQGAHWDFKFNSEASLLEGNRINDRGPGSSPRFLTTATVEGYAPLDQYLMGLRAPEEVPDTFLVVNPRDTFATGSPQVGVAFDGERRDIRIEEIIQAEGRRTPDHTVAQRRFRVAFVLVTAAGQEPSPQDIEQIETYRREFVPYFARVTSERAVVDTSFKSALRLSAWPAAGVVEGSTGTGSVELERASPAPVTVLLRSERGAIEVPRSVVVPAGAKGAQFTITARRQGVDDLYAESADGSFETVHARIQVAAPSALKLMVHSGNLQAAQAGVELSRPVQFRLTDINELPYPGVALQVAVVGGGRVTSDAPQTDENGIITLRWTPGREAVNELRASTSTGLTASAAAIGQPAITSNAVLNAASYAAGLTPGGIATLFGTNLSSGPDTQVLVNGQPAKVFYSDPRQINFLVPATLAGAAAQVTVRTSAGTSAAVTTPVRPVHPGIFFDTASNYGAIVTAGTRQVSQLAPVAPGSVIEIYATGLGALRGRADGLEETAFPPLV